MGDERTRMRQAIAEIMRMVHKEREFANMFPPDPQDADYMRGCLDAYCFVEDVFTRYDTLPKEVSNGQSR